MKINNIPDEQLESQLKYLKLLSKQYPSISSASAEIINLEAVLSLPDVYKRQLYKWGILDLPACIVYSFDKYYNDAENMKELDNIANQLADLRGRRQENNTLKQIVYILESEVERAFGIKLPYDMTNGRDVFFSTVMIPVSYTHLDVYKRQATLHVSTTD